MGPIGSCVNAPYATKTNNTYTFTHPHRNGDVYRYLGPILKEKPHFFYIPSGICLTKSYTCFVKLVLGYYFSLALHYFICKDSLQRRVLKFRYINLIGQKENSFGRNSNCFVFISTEGRPEGFQHPGGVCDTKSLKCT